MLVPLSTYSPSLVLDIELPIAYRGYSTWYCIPAAGWGWGEGGVEICLSD